MIRAFSRIWISPPAARFTIPCKRLRNELDELPLDDREEEVCIGRTPRLDDELLEEPILLEEVLELGVDLELLEEELGREDPPVPLMRSCIVA